MADQEESTYSAGSSRSLRSRRGPSSRGSQGSQLGEVVSEVTVRALQEFDSGEYVPEQTATAEQPASETEGALPTGSRPGTATKKTSRPATATSRPQSAKPEGDRPGSGAVRRTPTQDEEAQQPSSDRPASGRPASGRPQSGRPQSGRPQSGRPQSDRPQSSRPQSGRPQSSRPQSGRPRSSRPQSGAADADRPTSAKQPSRAGSAGSRKSVADRIAGGVDVVEETIDGVAHSVAEDDGLHHDETEMPPRTGYTGTVPPPTQAPHDLGNEGDLPGSEERENDAQVGDYPDDPVEAGAYSDHEDANAYEPEDLQLAEAEEVEESDEEESDLVVLDPSHPLMLRFQKALQKQLAAQHERVALEHSELSEAVKRKLTEREAVGVELYGVQQELARYQVMLEEKHDSYNGIHQVRNVKEQVLLGTRDEYKTLQLHFNDEKRKGAELQSEVENLALRLHYVNNAKDDVRSDINVMKRAAEKADYEVASAEAQKQKQDLYVDRLVESVDKLREDIAITDAQLTAQLEETKAAKEALNEASLEIDNITQEKKQLYAQWNSSLIGMKRRDEAHAAMQEALDQQRQRIKALETEIEGYKKQIAKEQEHNEKLTLVLNKCEVDIATSKKMLNICHHKMEALKTEYATYTRMLHETEEALNRAQMEKTQRGHDIESLRKQIEKEYLEKVRLEDEIMDMIRQQLTFDKAAQYTDRITKKSRNLTKDLESQIAVVENEIAQDGLNASVTMARTQALKETLDGLDLTAGEKNEIITKSENEIVRRNAVVERKQQIIDQFNKKLEQMISQAGGVELGPLEIQINSLSKSIESTQQDIASLQLMWLREQGELVRLSKEKDQSNDDVNMLKKKISILSQKKIRIENAIDKENAETRDIEKNTRNLRNDMIKLNILLHQESGTQDNLERENILTESDFIGKLKEAELESIQMQAKLDGLKEEKERLLNSLVESERQIMLWEKKTQLARETRAAVDSEVGQGEITAMKAEIHRMEVRYSQLMRQQEKMIQDMEKAVSRRDTIVNRGTAQAKIAQRNKGKDKTVTKGTFQRQLAELRKKIKLTIQDAQLCDEELVGLREDQQQLGAMLEEKQIGCRELEGNADTMEGDLERQVESKQRNMADLVAKQQKTKYFQQLREKKYKRIVKDDNMLDGEREKQVDRMQALSNIVERLQEEYPHLQPPLRKISLSLGSKIMAESGPVEMLE